MSITVKASKVRRKCDTPEQLAVKMGELQETTERQIDMIDEAASVNARAAAAAENLIPEVNQLRTALDAAVAQIGAVAAKIEAGGEANVAAARHHADAIERSYQQNEALIEVVNGLRVDVQSLAQTLRASR